MSTAHQPQLPSTGAGKPPLAGPTAGPVQDFDDLLGQGDDLWADDTEFEAFLAELRRWRQQDRDQRQSP